VLYKCPFPVENPPFLCILEAFLGLKSTSNRPQNALQTPGIRLGSTATPARTSSAALPQSASTILACKLPRRP